MYKTNYFMRMALLSILITTSMSIRSQSIPFGGLHSEYTFDNHNYNVSLPVGAISASADVSNGTSTYTIPIQIPMGTNGVAPDISLSYSSQATNGHFGFGWNITGISSITRGMHTIFHDGECRGVQLDEDDKFLLDGMRLLKHSGNSYVKEMHDYSVIESMGSFGSGPSWFRVETKFGVVMEYGKSNNSAMLSDDGSEIMFWRINKTIYKDGNYIEYIYDNSNRDSKLTEILYTGNDIAGLAPYNKIKFNYKDRGFSKNTTYEAGASIKTHALVDNIEITTENNVLVKKYELTYGKDDINAFLTKITEVGSDGSKLNPTIFKYGDIINEYDYDFIGYHPIDEEQVFTGDFNADGYSDKLVARIVVEDGVQYHDRYDIWTKSPNPNNDDFLHSFTKILPGLGKIGDEKAQYNFYSGDFTGEGRDDIVYAFSTEFQGDQIVRVIGDVVLHETTTSDANGIFLNGVSVNNLPLPPNAKQIFGHQNKSLNIGDYNGDGIMDIILILCKFVLDINGGYSLENYDAYIYYGDISSMFEELDLQGTSTLSIEDWGVPNINTIDIDGDGKNELMVTNGLHSEIYGFDGTTATSINGNALGFPTEYHLMFFGDFNGDRKTDVLTRTDPNNQNALWYVGRSTGKGFIEDSAFSWSNNQPDIEADYSGELLLIGDYNGDGRSDIARGVNNTSSQTIQFYFSTGEKWKNDAHTIFESAENNTFGVQDFNGDGKTDIMIRQPNDMGITRVLKYNAQGQELVLNKVKNGHGHEVIFNYSNMTKLGEAYTRTSMTDHPVNTIRVPMLLPSNLKKDGFGLIKYEYTNAKLHKEGKGFLGFEKIVESELGGDVMKDEVNYTLNPDFYFLSPESIIRKKGQTILNTKDITHTVSTLSDAVSGIDYFTQHVTGTTDNNAFEGRVTTTSTIYDDFGNAEFSTVDINGVEARNTNTIYEQHGSPIPSSPVTVNTVISRSDSPTNHTVNESMTYYSNGQLHTKEINPGEEKSVKYEYTYNNFGNIFTTEISALGKENRKSTSFYDNKGRYIESALNTKDQPSSSTYDPKWGKPLTTTGLDGLTNTFTYDAFGRLSTTTVPQGFTINEYYDWDSGSAIYKHSVIHPGDKDMSIYYDVLDREVKQEETGFNQTKLRTTEYNSKGLVNFKSEPSGFSTTIIYDDYDRPQHITNGYGTTTINYSFESGLLVETTTNPANQISTQKKDATNKIVETTDYGATQTYTYHANGELATVSDGVNTLLSTEYDIFGRQTLLNDKNAGVYNYDYDAYGQLVKEITPKGEETTIIYNELGQIESRIGDEGTTTYTYYSSGPEINLIELLTSFEENTTSHIYDSFGRILNETRNIDNIANTFSYTYDIYNHILTKTFPSGFKLVNTYNTDGYLTHIKDESNTQTIFENLNVSPMDLPLSYKSIINGDTRTTGITYAVDHVIPTSIISGDELVHNYTWDLASGNLDNRTQTYIGIGADTETFTYDNLNRLQSQSVNGINIGTTNYQHNGNIQDKSQVGTAYLYDADRINAVTGIEGADYSNLSMYNQYIKYNSFQQPEMISEHGNKIEFVYSADHQRIKSHLTLSTGEEETRYYHGDYETFNNGNETHHIHYINIGRGVHMIVERVNGVDTYHRVHTDYQGSIMYIGEVGDDEYYFNYDAWGRHRDPATLNYITTVSRPVWFNRGYTGHEHIYDFQLINMNGRLYDPVVGRMLSPDNNLQLPYYSQNYNRYSYALNNPLRFTDPDGEFIVPLLVGAAIAVTSNGINNIIHNRSFFDGAGKAALFGAIGGITSSAIGGIASQLTLGGASKIGVAAFQTIAHSWTAAVFSMAQGSDPLVGFYSGGLSSIVSSGIGSLGGGAPATLISGGLSGGIGAKLAGGNFWEGVSQGLITSGLNHLSHNLIGDPPKKGDKKLPGGYGMELEYDGEKWVETGRFFMATGQVNTAAAPWEYVMGAGLTRLGIGALVNTFRNYIGYSAIFLARGQTGSYYAAGTFMRSEIALFGKISIRDYRTISFQYTTEAGQNFSLGWNPWTRKIIHLTPNK